MPASVVAPRIRGFLSMSSHPDGCAANVRQQAELAAASGNGNTLGNALVLGSSTGYGLASSLSCLFGYGANTLGVCFEKAADAKRTATAGWYNVSAVHDLARQQGKQVETLNADAFADTTREAVISALRQRFGKLDLIVYSLASPRRTDPSDGVTYHSVLKPIGDTFSGKTIDLRSDTVTAASIEAASDEEIAATIKVMGGEDWQRWIEALQAADLLAPGCRSVAYSYIGPQLTYPIYRSGTIGRAKEDLERTALALNQQLQQHCGGGAWVSVNKALVTQASAAIPVVPLYISILFKNMKEASSHEGCMQQIARLFKDHLAPGTTPSLDQAGRIRLDDLELAPAIQTAVDAAWDQIDDTNLHQLSDYSGFKHDFARLFGFEIEGVDYEAETEIDRPWN